MISSYSLLEKNKRICQIASSAFPPENLVCYQERANFILCILTPANYILYIVKSNMKMVVQLNKKYYTNSNFEKAGMRNVEHFYLVGIDLRSEYYMQMVVKMDKLNDDNDMVVII